jgi:hypothetical protein
MSTTTSKLGLLRPDGTDPISRATQLNGNWNIVDAAMGVTECTSVTRPGSPYPGQVIRETDTLRAMVRNPANNAWVNLSGVPIVNNTTDITVPSNGQVVFSFTGFGLYVYKSTVSTWMPLTHDDYYTFRKGTSTNIGAGWTAVPFATTVEGSNQGISTADSISFTLTAIGIWSVKASVIPNGNAACAAALFRGTASVNPLDVGNTEVYSMTVGGNTGNVGAATVAADIRNDGGSTKIVRVSAFASGLSLYAGTSPAASRITFKWSPL